MTNTDLACNRHDLDRDLNSLGCDRYLLGHTPTLLGVFLQLFVNVALNVTRFGYYANSRRDLFYSCLGC